MDDDDLPVQKIQISGPVLASLLHRFSSTTGSLHGLLFGHVTVSASSSLFDDPTSADISSSAHNSPLFTATVTSFLSFPSHLPLPLPLHSLPDSPSSSLLGWFSGRRRTPIRPSLNDSTTTYALASSVSLSFSPQQNATSRNLSLRPSLFILMTTPLQDQLIHTHEYRAYQYRTTTDSFEPRSLDIINVGPSFRSQYESFSPNSIFPLISCELNGSTAMAEDHEVVSLGALKKERKVQKELDFYAEGFDIGRLGRLTGSDAANYTAELEDLYAKMLAKLEGLARSVETSSAKVFEQVKNKNGHIVWILDVMGTDYFYTKRFEFLNIFRKITT